MTRKKKERVGAHYNQGGQHRKARPVTPLERLEAANRELARLKLLAHHHPSEPVYWLAVERVQRDEIDPVRRLIAAKRRRKS